MVVLLVHALSLINQPLMPWRLDDLAPYAQVIFGLCVGLSQLSSAAAA